MRDPLGSSRWGRNFLGGNNGRQARERGEGRGICAQGGLQLGYAGLEGAWCMESVLISAYSDIFSFSQMQDMFLQ